MPSAEVSGSPPAEVTGAPPPGAIVGRRLTGRAALLPAMAAVALMLLWAYHDGGYDADTWYWGALVVLTLVALTLTAPGPPRSALTRLGMVAVTAFGAYVAWSYLSMAWSETPGWALEGSNRALLYLLVFGLFLIAPWTPRAAFGALLAFVLGVGAIGVLIVARFAFGDHVQQLVVDGRLAAPTGYFNSSVALFMTTAMLAIVLATRRELPSLVRGGLIAIAAASLQLCVIGQSRGWLFTLPVVVVVAIAVVPDRLRVATAAVLPVAGALLPVHTLLHAFQGPAGSGADHAAIGAGRTSLLICAAIMLAGTLIAWREKRGSGPSLSRSGQRRLGAIVAALVLVATVGGTFAATHGDPAGFLQRQWHGFSHPATTSSAPGSHFALVGSGRYDFWRVSLDALAAHPIGGLGQDNFADYYVPRRQTTEEPRWTHSLEMRLLAHTGLVGFGLFAVFLLAAVAAALSARRRGDSLTRVVSGAALLPLVVWLIHGSVDWFWEMPALTAPALGFLGMAAALGFSDEKRVVPYQSGAPVRLRRRIPRVVPRAVAALTFAAAVVVLGFPYLSVREVSVGTDIRPHNPTGALRDLATAAELNPLSPDPGRFGGTIALQTGRFTEAERRFHQVTVREPGGWFAWFGDGLAASALGDSGRARHDYEVAAAINSREPALKHALADVDTTHPLTPAQALSVLVTT